MDVILAWNPDEKPDDAPDERRCTMTHLSPEYTFCSECREFFRIDLLILFYADYGKLIGLCETCLMKVVAHVEREKKEEEEEAEV